LTGKTLILSFDMETDIGSWTSETQGLERGTPRILETLSRHSVPASFLFTGREAIRHPRIVKRIRSAGHEIGCHTMYHENLGPPVYDVPVGSFALEGEIEARLRLATDTIQEVAGVRPVSFRAPRLFGSTAMILALEKLGYLADSSFPSYYHGRDFLPYHPSRDDWSREGHLDILEVPVFYNMDATGAGTRNRGFDQWPMLRLRGGEWFASLCERMAKRIGDSRDERVLCVYLHPWEFVKIPRKIRTDESTISFRAFLWKNTGAYALDALNDFLTLAGDSGWSFDTLDSLAQRWDQSGPDAG
jgi:peptidoglycan/xylan/chitin deacetylase (PgdA/CDA1 family)